MSVPISFGLPLIAVGIALIVAALNSGGTAFWMIGVVALAGGLLLFASGRRL